MSRIGVKPGWVLLLICLSLGVILTNFCGGKMSKFGTGNHLPDALEAEAGRDDADQGGARREIFPAAEFVSCDELLLDVTQYMGQLVSEPIGDAPSGRHSIFFSPYLSPELGPPAAWTKEQFESAIQSGHLRSFVAHLSGTGEVKIPKSSFVELHSQSSEYEIVGSMGEGDLSFRKGKEVVLKVDGDPWQPVLVFATRNFRPADSFDWDISPNRFRVICEPVSSVCVSDNGNGNAIGILAPGKAVDWVWLRPEDREVSFILLDEGTLSGRVIGIDGSPVGGAVVIWKSVSLDGAELNTGPRVISDGDGKFILPHLPNARLTVTVEAQGFSMRREVQIDSGMEARGFDFILPETSFLSLAVFSQEGLPVPDAGVTVWPRPASGRVRSVFADHPAVWQGYSDANGRVGIQNLAPSRDWIVNARDRSGNQGAFLWSPVLPARKEVRTLQLVGGGGFEAWVLDETGHGVAGVEISVGARLLARNREQFESKFRNGIVRKWREVTDEMGNVFLKAIPAGRYSISIASDEWTVLDEIPSLVIESGKVARRRFEMTKKHRIAFDCLDRSGSPLRGRTVVLEVWSESNPRTKQSRVLWKSVTDQRGLLYSRLPTGRYSVQGWIGSDFWIDEPVSLGVPEEGSQVPVPLVFRRTLGANLIAIFPDGSPVVGAVVGLGRGNRVLASGRSITDGQGRAAVNGLREGSNQIVGRLGPTVVETEILIPGPSSKAVFIQFPWVGDLSVQLLFDDGSYAGNQPLICSPLDSVNVDPFWMAFLQSDSTGHVEVKRLPEGKYSFPGISPVPWSEDELELLVQAGRLSHSEGFLELRGSLRVFLQGQRGSVGSAQVELSRSGTPRHYSAQVTDDGGYLINGIETGEWTVRAGHSRTGSFGPSVVAVVPGHSSEVVLSPSADRGSIFVHVQTESGAQVPVAVQSEENGEVIVQDAVRGVARFFNLSEGDYRVTVGLPGESEASVMGRKSGQTVSVEAGRISGINVPLEMKRIEIRVLPGAPSSAKAQALVVWLSNEEHIFPLVNGRATIWVPSSSHFQLSVIDDGGRRSGMTYGPFEPAKVLGELELSLD